MNCKSSEFPLKVISEYLSVPENVGYVGCRVKYALHTSPPHQTPPATDGKTSHRTVNTVGLQGSGKEEKREASDVWFMRLIFNEKRSIFASVYCVTVVFFQRALIANQECPL